MLFSGSHKKLVVVLTTVAVFTEVFLYNIVVPFLPQFAVEVASSETAVGLLFAAYAAAQLAATPFMGGLSGRWGCRRLLLWGISGLAAGTALCLVFPNYVGLVSARIMQGIGGAAIWTAALALVAEVLPAEERGAGLGAVMSGTSAGALLGPVLGGWLYEWGGYSLPLIVGVGFCVGVNIALWRLLPSPHGPARILAFHSLLRSRECRVILVVVFAGATVLGMLEPLLPLHLSDHLHMTPAGIGMLFGLAAVAYGLCAPLAGHFTDRFGGPIVMICGLVGTALNLPLTAWPDSYVGEALSLILLGAACGFLLTPTLPALADVADQHNAAGYGVAYALFNTAYAMGMVAGPSLGGLLAGSSSFLTVLVVFASVMVTLLPFLFAVLRAKRPAASPHSEEESSRQAA